MSRSGENQNRNSLDFTGERMFTINKISVRAELSQGSQIYELRFTSQELIMNNRIKVSKSYTKTLQFLNEPRHGYRIPKKSI